jgi:site-specific DNA recombinase
MNKMQEISPPSLEELEHLLKRRLAEELSQDQKEVRYCIYLRKSTDDPEKQQRSIGDQRAECEEFARRKGLQAAYVYPPESQSAKVSGKRPIFDRMLEDIRKGKYEGVISWSPDRIARNLKEAGEVLDMLDSTTLKDLQLVTTPYDGTASSKMSLGIQFVMAKQYSDSLQENVNRGNKRSIGDATGIGKDKHGYFRDEYSYYRPNGRNFELIRQAWQLRKNNATYTEIGTFLERQGYEKAVRNKSGKVEQGPITVTPNMLTVMFRDPFYTGILRHGLNIANLKNAYDFKEAVSVGDFYDINRNDPEGMFKKGWRKERQTNKEAKPRANLLRGMVICGHCGKKMHSGITNKPGYGIYYYRCDTEGCTIKSRNVRAKVVMDFALGFLDHHPLATPAVWGVYQKQFSDKAVSVVKALESRNKSLAQQLNGVTVKIAQMKKYVLEAEDKDLRHNYEQDLKAKLMEQSALESQIAATKELAENSRTAPLSYAEFLELFSSLPDRIRKTPDLEGKDFYLREVFLNFTVTDKKVTAHTLVPDLAEAIGDDSLFYGRGERI